MGDASMSQDEIDALLIAANDLPDDLSDLEKSVLDEIPDSEHLKTLEHQRQLEKDEKAREALQQERFSIMKFPLEIRFLDKSISYQDFAGNKKNHSVAIEKFTGQTGELYFGNLKIGTAVYQTEGSLKITAVQWPENFQHDSLNNSANFSKEDLIPWISDAQFPVRILMEKGYMDLADFSKIQKDYRIKLKCFAGAPLPVYLRDIPIAHCEVVVIGDNPCGRICNTVDTVTETNISKYVKKQNESELTRPMIGFEVIFAEMKYSLNDLTRMAEGSILESDKSVFEPCRLVFANGVEFLADVIVIDDYFGLKIVKNLNSNVQSQKAVNRDGLKKRAEQINTADNHNGNNLQRQIFPDLDDPEKVLAEFRKDAEEFSVETAKLLVKALEMPKDMFQTFNQPGWNNESGKLENTPQKNAAILILLAQEDVSANLLKNFSPDPLEKVSLEIARLGLTTLEEKNFSLNFYRQLKAGNLITGGIEKLKKILEKGLNDKEAGKIINGLISELEAKPFDIIRKADTESLLNFIQSEHPQTIALILSCLNDTEKSSKILSCLPHLMQADVARRIATMDQVSSNTLRKVEWTLERKLASYSKVKYTSVGGIDSIVEMINRVDRGTEKSIIEALEEEDPILAEEIKRRMFVFKDIVFLEDRAIQKILREVDSSILAKALKIADDDVQEKIFKNMSPRVADRLREDIKSMDGLPAKDMAESQIYIINIIRKLEECGEILVMRPGDQYDAN
jgi:flagellar motor switch protein FliG